MFLRLRNQRRIIAIAHRSAGICGDFRPAHASRDQAGSGMVAGIGKIQGIKVLPIHQHLQVKVRAGGITGAAHFGNDIPLFDFLPGRYQQLGAVGVFCGKGPSVLHGALQHHDQPVAACFPGLRYHAVMPGQNLRALGHPNIHRLMIVLFSADGVDAVAIVACDIREPVGIAKHVRDILAVALRHHQDIKKLGLFRVHTGGDHVRKGFGRQVDIENPPLVGHFYLISLAGTGVRPGFRAGAGLHFLHKFEGILLGKDLLQHRLNILILEGLIGRGEKSHQLKGVVPDIAHMVAVFIVAGVVRFGIVNLHLQVGFPLRINQLSIVDVLIFRGIAGRRNRAGTACPYAGTGRKKGKNQDNDQKQERRHQAEGRVAAGKTPNRASGFFRDSGRFPGSLPGAPGGPGGLGVLPF